MLIFVYILEELFLMKLEIISQLSKQIQHIHYCTAAVKGVILMDTKTPTGHGSTTSYVLQV